MGIFQSTPQYGVRMTPQDRIASSQKNVSDAKELLAKMIQLQTKMRSGYKPTYSDRLIVGDLPRNMWNKVLGGHANGSEAQFKKLLAYQIKQQYGIVKMYSNTLAEHIRTGGKLNHGRTGKRAPTQTRSSRTSGYSVKKAGGRQF